ncbi:aminoglycoside N3'-acetyltransferase [Halanaerobium saccharolyticum]|uniref:Aminoglycoside N(3)-acetyltransferase n=1 Tax=Halanaerobium saccharolyticum TaxID=43595 RepID=A0A4R7YS62_9FIRM|nr:AAC(3) family N-acetyltransferase [Halanaerobium saccharolyticum]RAK05264.1 aminoglycoside N3'-acetyltransferase [Halanaerobium saccharolyticum]TDV99629.1 aminoglycoside N3'-acetyltransferase [Halanaerobium saccharolyticum]TDX51745.1 aminoglycoside N3'-acetyltransferase [Halanaerobium saccharolyticum]
MNEKEIINKTKKPITKKSLINDLKKLKLKGEVVIVHSALSKLGWVCGGAVALVEALQEVITAEGTLIMPAHSGDYSEPKYWGKEAEAITADHRLDYALGENSPLATIYEREGKILLIGVGHDCNTSLHLAEYRADYDLKIKIFGSSILKDGQNVWAKYQDIEFNDELFPAIGKEYETKYEYNSAIIGLAEAKLFDQKIMVDFAVNWLEKREN